jgi:CheY-like chemotaxis protein
MNASIPFPKPAVSTSAPGTAGKKILIVDDSVVILKLLSSKLRTSGYQVFTAVDGSEAVSTVRRERPDLILLDINFPPDVGHGGGVAWDGFLIMSWLRRMDEALHTPVIIITGNGQEQSRDRCMKVGVSGYFQKPINNEELLAAIARLLGTAMHPSPAVDGPVAKTVLLVDDENDWRYMAGLYLTDAGFQVAAASNGAEALEKMKMVNPGVVLLDLNLSGESGLDVMKLLKTKHPNVPIVLYTGMDHDKEAVESMLRLGAQQYLRKSTMGEMLKAVQSAFAA